MSDAELSYEFVKERKWALAQLDTLRNERDARHEEEKKQLEAATCFLKRWAIKCRADRQDWRDDIRKKNFSILRTLWLQ